MTTSSIQTEKRGRLSCSREVPVVLGDRGGCIRGQRWLYWMVVLGDRHGCIRGQT